MLKKQIAALFAIFLLAGLAYYASYLYASKEFAQQSKRIEQQLASEEPIQEASENPMPETKRTALPKEELEIEEKEAAAGPDTVQKESFPYYLVEEFGYINIYLSDRETIYEYTNIPIDSLPEELQLEICTGKGVASEQDLYDFLENYSS